MLGFAIAMPVAASALASPVGLRVVLRLNKRFFSPSLSFPGDLDETEMIEAVSSSFFLGERKPLKPPPLLADATGRGLLDVEAAELDGVSELKDVLSAVGLSTMGVMVTAPSAGSGDVAALACCGAPAACLVVLFEGRP